MRAGRHLTATTRGSEADIPSSAAASCSRENPEAMLDGRPSAYLPRQYFRFQVTYATAIIIMIRAVAFILRIW
jgi:hypothetical protein